MSVLTSLFSGPKVPKIAPPPTTPTKADATVLDAGDRVNIGYSSLVNTGDTGLKKKANTKKRSLIGGD